MTDSIDKKSVSPAPAPQTTGSIRTKLLILLIGSFSGLLFLAVLALHAVSISKKALTADLEDTGKIITLATEAEQNLLLADQQAERFFARFVSQDAAGVHGEVRQHFDRYIKAVQDNIKYLQEDLQNQPADKGHKPEAEAVATLLAKLENYKKSVDEGLELFKAQSSSDQNLPARLNQQGILLQNLVTDLMNKEPRFQTMQLRILEKDYLLHSAINSWPKVTEHVENLKHFISSAYLPIKLKQDFFNQLAAYMSAFSEMNYLQQQMADLNNRRQSTLSGIFPEIQKIIEINRKNHQNSIHEALAITARIFDTVLLVTLASVVLLLSLFFFIASRFNMQITSILQTLFMVNSGDFTARAKVICHDELGKIADSLNHTVETIASKKRNSGDHTAIHSNLLSLLATIKQFTSGTLSARADMTDGSTAGIAQSFNTMADQLCTEITHIADMLGTLTEKADATERSTRILAESSLHLSDKIQAGKTLLPTFSTAISEITHDCEVTTSSLETTRTQMRTSTQQVKRTYDELFKTKETMRIAARAVRRLGENSTTLGAILHIVQDISERTTILSINAAVQASMVGEAGKGFTVIAAEMQRLAERSSAALKKVEVQASTLLKDMSTVKIAMEKSIQSLLAGAALSSDSMVNLRELIDTSNLLFETIEAINRKLTNQDNVFSEMKSFIENMPLLAASTGHEGQQACKQILEVSETAHHLKDSLEKYSF